MTGSLLALIGILVLLVATITMNHNRQEPKGKKQAFLPLALALGVIIGVGLSAMLAVESVLAWFALIAGGAAVMALIYSTATQQD